MTRQRATQTFHHVGGTTVGGTVVDGDDQLVADFPGMFEPVDPEPVPPPAPVTEQKPAPAARASRGTRPGARTAKPSPRAGTDG